MPALRRNTPAKYACHLPRLRSWPGTLGCDKAEAEVFVALGLELESRVFRSLDRQRSFGFDGHPGGAEEAAAVEDWATARRPGFTTSTETSPGPVLYLVERSR